MEGYVYEQYAASAEAIRARIGSFRPRVLLILGSGLGSLGDEVEDPIAVPYSEIPHMKFSTAPGHKGQFLFGRLAGCDVAVMQGRLHAYEGWSFADAAYPVRVARLLGAETLIVTNAAGAVNVDFEVGDIMLITDHIKLFGDSPLRGPNVAEFGPRFPDSTHTYTPALQAIARKAAETLSITLREGVYMYFPGPQYETPAEIRAARLLGADAVGMSTVVEAMAARHCGLRVCAVSCIANKAAGISPTPLSGEEVLEAANAVAPRFRRLLWDSVAAMHEN